MEEFRQNDNASTDFQEIEMQDLNNDCRINNTNLNREVVEVITKSRIPLRVYIQHGQKDTALITFHDIGTNHNSFLSFFNCPEMLVILDNFTVYNICAPGHHSQDNIFRGLSQNTDEKFRLLSNSNDSDMFVHTKNAKLQSILTPYPTMESLAEMIESVVEHFQLKLFLGMGVGAGANVMARYGMKNPNKLFGLFLINPDDSTSGYFEVTKMRFLALSSLKSGNVTVGLEDFLAHHWFGSGVERNLAIQECYLQLLHDIYHPATAGYIESYMSRAALGLIRPLSSLDKLARTIAVDTFLVTGEMDSGKVKAMVNMNSNMDPSKTQFLSVPGSSGMVMEEAPGKVAHILLNFLRNLGMMVTMTNERLQRAAHDRQTARSKGLLPSA